MLGEEAINSSTWVLRQLDESGISKTVLEVSRPCEGMEASKCAKSLLDKARARAEKLNTARLEKQKKAELRKKVAAEEPGTGSTNEPAAVEESSTPQGNDELHPPQEVEVEPPTHSETVSRKRARDSEEVVEDEPARKMASRKKQVVSKGKKRQPEPSHPPNTERALAISPLSSSVFLREGHFHLPEILRDFAEDEVEIIGTSERVNTDPTISFDPVRIRVTRPTRPSSSFRACGPSFSEGSKGSSHVDPREGILVDDPKVAASVIKSALPEEIESRLGRLSRLDLAELLRLQGLSNLFLSHRYRQVFWKKKRRGWMSLLTEYIRRSNETWKRGGPETFGERAQGQGEDFILGERDCCFECKQFRAPQEFKSSRSLGRSFAEKKLSEAKEEVKAVSLEITSLRGVAEFLEKENGELLKQLKDSNSTLVTITSERDALRNNHESISKEVEACQKSLSESKQKVEELEMVCSEARQVTESALEEARDEGREESFPVLKEFVLKFPNADFANLTYIEALEALAGGARDANMEEELGNNDGVTTTFLKGSE
ncbi:hypothetical protein J5N97_014515 [Dioscorea zingiberensis]|uniref:Uncharacterized protein n=1 Tax=Dioscorea zingiberensis TaxID=325984 RepID=A0A9D5CSM0_9LILI|nr:hypothetical protein J5N97_014515 [Dioscorea zingiberensis]